MVLSLEVDGLGGPGVSVESDRAQRVHELGADVGPDGDDDDDVSGGYRQFALFRWHVGYVVRTCRHP